MERIAPKITAKSMNIVYCLIDKDQLKCFDQRGISMKKEACYGLVG